MKNGLYKIQYSKTFGDLVVNYAYFVNVENGEKQKTEKIKLHMSIRIVNNDDIVPLDSCSKELHEYHFNQKIEKLKAEGFEKKVSLMI